MTNCPNCGAPLRAEPSQIHFTCQYCRSTVAPPAGRDGVTRFGQPSAHSCPVCLDALEHAAIGGSPVESCPRCRGVLIAAEWFLIATQELRRLGVEDPFPHPPPRALDRHLACPHCGRVMDTHPYAGPGAIIIDNCPRCSLNWLDAGELQLVVHAARESWRTTLVGG